ncbi:MAG: heme ABC exporter ATP-binding protein CcmA [Alphaproteobacteria bacterium]
MESLQLIEVKSLACVRGGRDVFQGLNFRAAAGETVLLQGPNGAGKTSTLRILAGLLPQAAGSVTLRDQRGTVTDAAERAQIAGWLGHQDGIKGQMTVFENVHFFAALFGAVESPESILDRVGLSASSDWPAQFLSAGQRRRLALARLLLGNRPLWLLDEPLAALDAEGRELVASLVRGRCEHGGIAVVASHGDFAPAAQHVRLGTQK